MNRPPHDDDPFCVPPEDQAAFDGYVQTKAERFQELGADKYREEDFFNMPDQTWEPKRLEAVACGMAQLAKGRGFAPETPLENVGVAGFHALMATLQMRVKANRSHKEASGYLDTMALEHRVTQWKGVLYNLV
jgi:hypothetical protein